MDYYKAEMMETYTVGKKSFMTQQGPLEALLPTHS